MTTKVEKSIQVDVPVTTAYNQWTQFEDFPHFMGGVKEVRQLTDDRMHWVAEIAGVRREWEAAVLEQDPDRKVAWAATSGATNAGAVRFEPAGPSSTIVYLELEYEPEGLVEQVGDKLGIVGRQAQSDLERFKQLVESQGYASGAWRGSVNEHVDVGTPTTADAYGSHGDKGKAGVSGAAVAAGVAAVAGAAAAGVAAATSSSGSRQEEVPAQPTEGVVQPQEVTVVEQPPPDVVVRDDVLVPESGSEGYTATSSTEGVEHDVRRDGDDPMIGGGNR
ncbi:Polyketide cyclase / dehydrase and lipid transport [Geodermatophilus telluris]|uniref:Polyketide cyclase / dehydrase and lipid transport n=1 Tax=Geodermatophilus telluris TaxID=1190417 RepID=A0A1G6MDB6_9ACTN|nr:SRPBCC family protein [Geodermatophilus telluris]SDC53277.1 Polyketide cyclase / dehydrase and lipid transport [Geodermatophilus telluris]